MINIWYLIFDTGYLTLDILYLISDTWFPILDIWHLISDTWYMIQGVSKKSPEFSCITRIAITWWACNGFTSRFFLLKAEIHTQILNTEPFLSYIRGLRYLQNKTWFWGRQMYIHLVLQYYLWPWGGLSISLKAPDRPMIDPEYP